MLSKQCVVCGTTDNLNTSFDLVLFGNTYKVFLCTEHEDTTMKAAREMLQDRLMKIDTFIEEAKSHGLNFVFSADDVKNVASNFGFVCLTQEEYEFLKSQKAAAGRKIIAPSQKFVKQASRQQPSEDDFGTVEAGVVDHHERLESIRPTPADGIGQDMQSYAPIATKREKGLKVESKTITTKGGRVIDNVTTSMKSSEGTTKINIVQGIDDSDLQKRMKTYDAVSKSGMEVNRKNMYRHCGSCSGLGSYTNGTVCARCKGSGLISNF